MTSLLVQKYGGSVLSSDEAIVAAARRIRSTVETGSRVVAVVSARRGVTDSLLALARSAGPADSDDDATRDSIDLLASTGEVTSAALLALNLRRLGIGAVALNPLQIGIETDGRRGDTEHLRVNPLLLKARLGRWPVVVVPGFVGRSWDDRITTLGRGGSDLSAMALAESLGADACEFFKDVPGYFSADPAIVEDCIHRPHVTVDEALELARAGCRFLQDRAIQWVRAQPCRVRLRALDDERATELHRLPPDDSPAVTAITSRTAVEGERELALISLVGHDRWRDPERRHHAARIATDAEPTARVESSSPHRITFSVAQPAGCRVMHALHRRLVLESGIDQLAAR